MSNATASGSIEIFKAQRLFEHLASSTWRWLEDARRLSLGFSEDTISDLTMLEIGRAGLDGVSIERVSKRREHFFGFDWLWLISGPGVPPTAYVVQAKKQKLKPPSSLSYGKLRYPTGPGFQIDALEAFAKLTGAIPLYCFYNNVDRVDAADCWGCLVQQPPDVSQMGCTLAPLALVRQVHDGPYPKNFLAVHHSREALPWRCLFHFPCTRAWPGGILGQNLDRVTRRRSELLVDNIQALHPEGINAIDAESLIRQLQLQELVETHASAKFLPVPERVLTLTLEG